MKRGDVVTVAASGDFGKPRPAVIVQSDTLTRHSSSLIVCPMTTTLNELDVFRTIVEPQTENGLRVRSQIMVDRPTTVRKERVGRRIGSLGAADLGRLNKALAAAVGLFD